MPKASPWDKGAILTIVERKTAFLMMRKLDNGPYRKASLPHAKGIPLGKGCPWHGKGLLRRKQAGGLAKQLIDMLIPYKNAVLSITSDNGGEFAPKESFPKGIPSGRTEHQTISKKLKTDFFFANPYASWERGLSEGFLWKMNTPIPKESLWDKLIRQYIPIRRIPWEKELIFRILQINKSPKYNIKSTDYRPSGTGKRKIKLLPRESLSHRDPFGAGQTPMPRASLWEKSLL